MTSPPADELAPKLSPASARSQRQSVLGLLALVTLPFLVLAGVTAWRSSEEAQVRVAEERVGLARAAALRARSFIDANLLTARTLALTNALRDPASVPNLMESLKRFLAVNPDWEEVSVTDEDGWNIASTAAPPRSLYFGDRSYFRRMLATDQPVLSPAVMSGRTGKPTVVLAVPIDFADGRRGGLVVSLSPSRLAADLQAFRSESGVRIAVVDGVGNLLIRGDSGEVQELASFRAVPGVEAALAGETGSLTGTMPSGAELLIAYAPEPAAGWALIVGQSTADAFVLVRRQLAEQLGLLLLAVLITGVVGWGLSGKLDRAYQSEVEARSEAEATATALRASTEENEARRRFLEHLIASAPAGIAVLVGPDHRIANVNPVFEALQPGAEMSGRRIAESCGEIVDPSLLEVLDQVYASGEQYTAPDRIMRIKNESGQPEERYFTIVVARYETASGQPLGVLLIVTETTEAVMVRQQVEREKDEFLSMASHELKTPLTSLMLSAQMIERQVARSPIDAERLERLAQGMQLQMSRASELIGELLDVSRLDYGGLRVRQGRVDLAELVRSAAQRERDTLLDDPSHEIIVEPLEESLVVEGDESRLDQVLTNLLSNAVKYSPEGGAVRVRLDRQNGYARVSVADQGIGIPEPDRPTLFAPFKPTSAARTRGIEGTGLGLYISRRIVEAHGGRIEVGDTPGGGTTFTVSLPLADESE